MRMNRKAVTDLPIKLLVICILLCASLPVLGGAIESSETSMDSRLMEDTASQIGKAVASVYYSSEGFEKVVDINVPEGCSIIIGGEEDEAYAMHLMRKGKEISTYWMEKPIVAFADMIEIQGHCLLSVKMIGTKVKVAVL